MTKREFITWYVKHKRPEIEAMYPLNDPHRVACLAMSLTDLELEEAPKFWRKYRQALAPLTIDQWQQRVSDRASKAFPPLTVTSNQ